VSLGQELFGDDDTQSAPPVETPVASSKRSHPKPSRQPKKPRNLFGFIRGNRSNNPKGKPMSAEPVRPFASARPPRQTPKVVTHTYRVAGGWLRAIQPVNALIVAAVLTAVLTMLHGWSHLSLHGVWVGLLFSAVELALFSGVLHLLDASARKPAMVYAAVFVVVVMLAVFAAVVVKMNSDLFSVLVVFAYVVAIADPVGFVNAKMSLQAEREEFDAEKQAFYAERDEQNDIIGERLRLATETLSNAHVTEERLLLKEARLDATVEERIQEGVTNYATRLRAAVEDTLGVVQAKEAAEAAAAEHTAARQQYNITYEQLHEQARVDARREMAGEIENLERRATQGRFIPDALPTPDLPSEESAAHAVVTGETIR
jgi:hypothetical protein